MKKAMLISRIFVGLVFVFSGFVKAIDPSGSAIKLEEYFMAFHMEFLAFLSFPFAILLGTCELFLGLNLLIGLRMKFIAWLLLIFMSYFTLLTLILALTNPVSDCGCFGDAIKLTNWQTFGKNIVLDIPALFIFLRRKDYAPIYAGTAEWFISFLNFMLPVLLSVYCLLHQPLLDFRPYSIGISIPESMSLPEGSPVDKYETILIYEKDHIRKEFTQDNFPWQDTTWKWVETRQKLIFKGEEPPIHDFSITNADGNDITKQVLDDSTFTFVVIAPKLEHASLKGMNKMNDLAMKIQHSGMHILCLTSSSTSQVQEFKKTFQPAFEISTSDETTLKTIIRANPGLLLLFKGTILGKWNYRDAPDVKEINQHMFSVVLTEYNNLNETRSVFLLALFISLLYCLLHFFLKNRERKQFN
jgi:uncharacterized membrane protein YphA (DoxX/SURF4 family)